MLTCTATHNHTNANLFGNNESCKVRDGRLFTADFNTLLKKLLEINTGKQQQSFFVLHDLPEQELGSIYFILCAGGLKINKSSKIYMSVFFFFHLL